MLNVFFKTARSEMSEESETVAERDDFAVSKHSLGKPQQGSFL